MKITLDDLDYSFYVVSNTKQLEDIDTSFSYHVLIQDDTVIAMCNDIPCRICKFDCKQGKNRNKILGDFALENFPEMRI